MGVKSKDLEELESSLYRLTVFDLKKLFDHWGKPEIYRAPLLNRAAAREMMETGDMVRATLPSDVDKAAYDEILAGYIEDLGDLRGPLRAMMRRAAAYEVCLQKAIAAGEGPDVIDVWEKLLARHRKGLGLDKPKTKEVEKGMSGFLAAAMRKMQGQSTEPELGGRIVQPALPEPPKPVTASDLVAVMAKLAEKVSAAPEDDKDSEWDSLFLAADDLGPDSDS